MRVGASLPVCLYVSLPSVGVVLDGLGVDLTAAHVFDSQGQPLSVLDLRVHHGLQVGLLHLAVLGPDDLAIGVHGHSRLLTPELSSVDKHWG